MQGLEAAQQPDATDAAPAAATSERLQACRERLAAARQLEACWEGLSGSWPLPAAVTRDLLTAAAAAAYGRQSAALVPPGSCGPAQLQVLGCADVPAQWAAAGLPADERLIVSAAMMRHAQQLPVMADPEGFGAVWLRHMHMDGAKLQVWLPC